MPGMRMMLGWEEISDGESSICMCCHGHVPLAAVGGWPENANITAWPPRSRLTATPRKGSTSRTGPYSRHDWSTEA